MSSVSTSNTSLIRPLPTNAGLSDYINARKSVHLILDDGSKVNVEENGKITNFNIINEHIQNNVDHNLANSDRKLLDANISLTREIYCNTPSEGRTARMEVIRMELNLSIIAILVGSTARN